MADTNVFDCRIGEIIDGNLEMFPEPQRLAQEVVVIGQELGTVALGEASADTLLSYARGTTEPARLDHVKMALLTATHEAVKRDLGGEAARTFLRRSQPYLGDIAVIQAIASMSEETITTTATDVQDAVWALLG